MNVTLQYFDGCPNWKQAEANLEALRAEGLDIELSRELIDTPEAAAKLGFRGSPTILVEGADPFADPDAPVGLACRVYDTPAGRAGSPDLEQLRTALEAGR